MQTFETAAIISLIDHLSGPLRSLAGTVDAHSSRFEKSAAKMAETGRSMTLQMSLPIAMGIKAMTHHALEYSQIENTMHGILLNRARTMGDLKMSHDEYAKSQERILDNARKMAIADPALKGMINPLDWKKSAMAATKAGLDAEAAAAVATQGAQLGIVGRMTQDEAAEGLITLGNAFGVVTKNADGSAKSLAEVQSQYSRLGDMVSTAATNTNMSAQDAVESMKLPAPIWTLNKQDPGFLMAMAEAMAEKGIKGSEAGVSLRAFTMAASGPKSTAMPMLANAGIDMTKFQERNKQLTPEGLVQFEKNQGKILTMAAASKAFADATGADGLDAVKLSQNLVGAITHTGKAHAPVTPDQAQKDVAKYFNMPVMKTNMMEEVLKMRGMNEGMGPTAAQMKLFGEGRQAPRWTAFLNPTQGGGFDPFEFAMKRMYGENWKEDFAKAFKDGKGAPDPKFLGNMQRQAVEHMQGLEGSLTNMKNAGEELHLALYESGFYQGIADGLHKMAGAVQALSHSNPDTLKHLAEGLVLLAAVGPIAWLGGTLLGLARGLAMLAAIPASAAGVPAVLAGAAKALGAGAAAGGEVVGGVGAGAAALPAALGVVAATVATGVLKETMSILHDLGAIDSRVQPHSVKGHWENERNGRSTSRKWVPDSMFDRETTNGGAMSATGRAWNGMWAPDPWAHGRNASAAHQASHAELAAIPTISPTSSSAPTMTTMGTGGTGVISQLTSAITQMRAMKPEPVDVHGDVKGAVDVHSTMTVSPSQWFITKIDMLEHATAQVSGKLAKLGETMAGSNATQGAH